MKIVILNYCGTVGKTTIATNLFQPRMNNAKIIAVDTINMTASDLNSEAEVIKTHRFKEIYQQILIEDNLVIDVGASNIENFLSNMVQYQNSHEEIDYFIIPVTAGEKEQRESMNTAIFLLEIGILANKIKFIFNKVNDDVEVVFHKIFSACQKKNIPINKELYIMETELFDELINSKVSLHSIINDSTDYKKMIKDAATSKEKIKYADLMAIRSLSQNIHIHFDNLFSKVFL